MLVPHLGLAQSRPPVPGMPNALNASTVDKASQTAEKAVPAVEKAVPTVDKAAPTADPVKQATAALMQWRKDWENRDFERFSAHHAAEFRVEGADRERFLERKRAIFEHRPWHRIRLSEVLWIVDGSNPTRLTVQFVQDYESAAWSERSRKEQRWAREADGWRLIGEQEAPLPDAVGSRRAAR
jgi:murein L,D-transpeptidase YafK